MTAPELTKELLRGLRNQFFPDDEKAFYQQRNMLLQAVTFPARWLDQRGVQTTEARYRQIWTTIIQTIKHHGDTSKIRRFGPYLLHCVQLHMKHHGEKYYDDAKNVRNQVNDVMHGLKRATKKQEHLDDTAAILSGVHQALTSARPTRRKKVVKPAIQPSLF